MTSEHERLLETLAARALNRSAFFRRKAKTLLDEDGNPPTEQIALTYWWWYQCEAAKDYGEAIGLFVALETSHTSHN